MNKPATPPPFGHFSEDQVEYIFTDPFAPPRFQVNYMWNDQMISGVNQFGTGEGVFNDQTMLVNCPEGRVRMIREGRRYFYLQDRESNTFWNTGLFPVSSPAATLQTRVGLGYSVFTSRAQNIVCESTVAMAADEPVERWEFHVLNDSQETRSLAFVPYVEWLLGGYDTFSSPYSYLRSVRDLSNHAVLSYNTSDERPHPRYNAFIAADHAFEEWCGGRRDFLGPFGTITHPQALTTAMSCQESCCEELAGAMRIPLTLPPGASETVTVLLGSFDTEEEKDRLIQTCLPSAYGKNMFQTLKTKRTELAQTLSIETPDPAINRLMNIWTKHQIQLCTEFGRDGARGFRDTLQDAWAILPFNAPLAKAKILETISHQHSDGHGIRGWMPLQPHHYSDGPTWIAPTVAAYLKETGDFDFLEAKAPYLDGGEGTVLDHMLRGLRHLSEDLGVHHLVLAHEGDWNDSLNWMGRAGKGESVWTSMALFHSLTIMEELCREVLQDHQLGEEMMQRQNRIEEAIETHGWDGEWYLAGYSDAGRKVGSSENREGQLFLNPQTWAILTGLAKGERREKCLQAIDSLDTPLGSLTLSPPYTQEDKHVGRVSVLLPGMYENGTPYCHGTAFKIAADCVAGRPDIALESFYKVLPNSPRHPSSQSGCEPYAFTNQYLGPANARAGASISGWISGTAGWMFRAMHEYFLGIQPGYHNFTISPCLPKAWPQIDAVRHLRGRTYRVSMEAHTGKEKLFVNGRPCRGKAIDY